MTIDEKVMQLNQYTLGLNNNANNIGEEVKEIPAELGSLIYFNADPALRNAVQRRAMEESRLGIPMLSGSTSSTASEPSIPYRWHRPVRGIRRWWAKRAPWRLRKPASPVSTGLFRL